MHNVLYSLFNSEVPQEISCLFSQKQELHDSPEEGPFWDGTALGYNWYDEHHGVERREVFDLRATLSEVGSKLGPRPKELLGKAVGKGEGLCVWDVTAGTGRDALCFYRWGLYVVAFERNPIIAALLLDGLRRAPELRDRLQIIFGDPHLMKHSSDPDILYYDPMYPDDVKKSRPRKEMVLFKNLIRGDSDQEEVMEWALNSGAKRIILKRPIKASAFNDGIPKPTASFKGKTIRFDLWQRG